MKNRGLRNRFNREELEYVWSGFYRCLWCNRSGFDCFHHVKSPSSQDYKKGNFNKSVLNSCPLHNHSCHLYNAQLHKKYTESMLLSRILTILLKQGYQLKARDKKFMEAYADNYEYTIDKSQKRT